MLCCVFLLLSACTGQATAAPAETMPAERGRWLDISAEVLAENPKPTTELTVPGTDRTLSYKGLIEPKILIDGSYVPLEKAVENGQITPEQVVCYAQLDAAEKNCREFYYTENGLTQFTYFYEDYVVWVVWDVFQTPAKGDRLIREVLICDYIQTSNLSNSGFKDENGNSLGSEDWGLTFEVAEVTATGMTLRITQSGGQHIGKLCITQFTMTPYEWTGEGEVPVDFVGYMLNAEDGQYVIENDGVTEFYFDWEAQYGAIAPGSYQLRLYLQDAFDARDVHPLMRDFTDAQMHTIEEVTVP